MNAIIKEPFRGAPHTVATIQSGALEAQNHYEVRQLAEDICRDLRSKDYLSEILAIYHYICANTRYLRDPKTVELVRSPRKFVEELLNGHKPQGDCDDLSALLAALLLSVGCQVRIVTVAFAHVKYRGERQYSHVFTQAYEPRSQTWVSVDPVAGEKTKNMHARGVAFKVYPMN